MKRIKLLTAIFPAVALSLLFAGCSADRNIAVETPDGTITYQEFYDDLSPYGNWIDYPPYGEVWSPDLAVGFRPYATNGRWFYTNAGWAWDSFYSWGWAPFHYGRWLYDDVYGWLWVPGYEWSPAWVTWGFYNNFYCWAPLMPGINVGIAFGGYLPHSIYWNAVDRRHIYDRDLGPVLIHRDQVENIHSHISIINNYNHTTVHNQFYSRGPEINDVERYTDTHISPVRIHDVQNLKELGRDDRGNLRTENGEMNVYRPVIRRSQPREVRVIGNHAAAEPQVAPLRDLRTPERIMGQREEQRENVRSLPIFRAPETTMPRFRSGRIESHRR